MFKLKNALQMSHFLLEQTLQPGDIAIDATVGNGHDTAFMAQLCGKKGHVFGFDIQKQAIENTQTLLNQLDYADSVTLFNHGHETADQILASEVSPQAVIFNLGYLPGGDKTCITRPKTTLMAIQSLLKRLEISGLMLLVIYYGHPGGEKEKNAILDFVGHLPQNTFSVAQYGFLNQQHQPPFLIAIQKFKNNLE